MLGKKLFERYQNSIKEITGNSQTWQELSEIEQHSYNVAADGLLIDMSTGDVLVKLLEASQRQRTLTDDPEQRYYWGVFIDDLNRLLAWWRANIKTDERIVIHRHRELREIKAEIIFQAEALGKTKTQIALTNCQFASDLMNVCFALLDTDLRDAAKKCQAGLWNFIDGLAQ